jgi:transposase
MVCAWLSMAQPKSDGLSVGWVGIDGFILVCVYRGCQLRECILSFTQWPHCAFVTVGARPEKENNNIPNYSCRLRETQRHTVRCEISESECRARYLWHCGAHNAKERETVRTSIYRRYGERERLFQS